MTLDFPSIFACRSDFTASYPFSMLGNTRKSLVITFPFLSLDLTLTYPIAYWSAVPHRIRFPGLLRSFATFPVFLILPFPSHDRCEVRSTSSPVFVSATVGDLEKRIFFTASGP